MDIAVDTLEMGPFATNCYLVRAHRGAEEAVVVDPSGPAAEIRLRLASLGARCAGILVTHGHFDHVLGLAELVEGTGAHVWGPRGDLAAIEDPAGTSEAARAFGVRPATVDTLLEGGETVEVAGMTFDVMHLPGHSPGHISFHAVSSDGVGHLLSGDVLFAGSVGRTDLPGCSWEALQASIARLYDAYPEDTVVYPGHGPKTTLGLELQRNPFLDSLRTGGDRPGSDSTGS
jgi:glyoxylase-like metal-dependent hydrolase (beta-lactamase superfamily II)